MKSFTLHWSSSNPGSATTMTARIWADGVAASRASGRGHCFEDTRFTIKKKCFSSLKVSEGFFGHVDSRSDFGVGVSSMQCVCVVFMWVVGSWTQRFPKLTSSFWWSNTLGCFDFWTWCLKHSQNVCEEGGGQRRRGGSPDSSVPKCKDTMRWVRQILGAPATLKKYISIKICVGDVLEWLGKIPEHDPSHRWSSISETKNNGKVVPYSYLIFV